MNNTVAPIAPIELGVLNLSTRKVFTKQFYSAYLARKFINKAKHSKKIEIVSVFGNLG